MHNVPCVRGIERVGDLSANLQEVRERRPAE
jgi:hypothetical protein